MGPMMKLPCAFVAGRTPSGSSVALGYFGLCGSRVGGEVLKSSGTKSDQSKCQAVLVTVSVLLIARNCPVGDAGITLRGITTKR